MEPPAREPRAHADSRLRPVTLPGPAGTLEGLLQEHEGRTADAIAVVCHPHPQFGGTMHNKVVHRVASVLHEHGASVLRFNFRGVGASAGAYDDGAGELDDARAALRWMEVRHPGASRTLAGFSFGSWVAARLAASEAGVARLVLVAPPVTSQDFSVMRTTTVPKLVLQGTEDDHCPLPALEKVFPTWAAPKTLLKIDGASHFFDKRLAALGDALHRGLGR